MDTKNPVPPVAPTFTPEQFQELLAFFAKGGASQTEAMMDLVKAQNDMVAATQRTVRHSNSYTPGISPFSHPEGEEAHPKGHLDRETWWLGTRVEHTQATPAEIDAFNKVTTNKIWRGDPRYGSQVTPTRRIINIPHVSMDERMGMPPSIPLVIRELIDGEDAIDPIKMEEKIRLLEKQVTELATKVNLSAEVPLADVAAGTSEF
jgi:hypothetical protein